MASLPELPPELQRLIRERAHRKTSMAEAEILTGRAIAKETRRTPVDDVRASDVKGRRPTVEFAEASFFYAEPDIDSRPPSYSGPHTDDPATRQPPVDSIAEPSFHSRPGTGTGTLTGYSYSPFRDAGPDEISWINRYRSYCHPPRPLRRPLSTWSNHHSICSSSPSYRPTSCPNYSPNPFSVVPCHLLPRSRDTERSASPDGSLWKLPVSSWKHAVTSASEARRRPDAGLASSSPSGALRDGRTKSGHPLRRTCSAHHPPRSTTANYHSNDRGPTVTRDHPSFYRQVARNITALNKLCSSITICSMVGEGRPAASPRIGSVKKLISVASRGKPQQEAKQVDKDRKSTDGRDAVEDGEVSVKDGINGTFTDGTVPVAPGKHGSNTSVNGTVAVNDGTNVTQNGTVSVNGGTDATTSETILTPIEDVSFTGGTAATTNGTDMFNDGRSLTPSGNNSNRS